MRGQGTTTGLTHFLFLVYRDVLRFTVFSDCSFSSPLPVLFVFLFCFYTKIHLRAWIF